MSTTYHLQPERTYLRGLAGSPPVNVGEDVATKCVLRAVNASKCVCGRGSAREPTRGTHSSTPDPLAGFGRKEK